MRVGSVMAYGTFRSKPAPSRRPERRPEGDGKEKETDPNNGNSTSDPSGYVYEAVPGNRLQGAEVSLYCEDDISQAPLLWDAVAYGQEARQVTGADGAFGWDVPDGRWQVRCFVVFESY